MWGKDTEVSEQTEPWKHRRPELLELGGGGEEVPSESPEEGGVEDIEQRAGFLSHRKPLKFAEPLQGGIVALEKSHSCSRRRDLREGSC